MSNDDITDYINTLTVTSVERLDNEHTSLIMIYDDDDPNSHRQFRHFKESATYDIMDRISPVERRSELGRRFVNESRMWAEKMADDKLKIDFTPTFIDSKTHRVLLVGFHTIDELKRVMS